MDGGSTQTVWLGNSKLVITWLGTNKLPSIKFSVIKDTFLEKSLGGVVAIYLKLKAPEITKI